MNSRLKRLLLPLLRGYIAGKPRSFRSMESARQALFLLGKGIKKPSQGRLRRVFKRSTKKEETAKIREAVFARAAGFCEACSSYPASVMDHWLGGSGRRTQQQSEATCWAICQYCDRLRTANQPSPQHWNMLFHQHCGRHGYSFTPHVVHAQLPKAGGTHG